MPKKAWSADALKMHRTLYDEKYIEQFFLIAARFWCVGCEWVSEWERFMAKWEQRAKCLVKMMMQ